MALTPGTRLGPYEVVALVGAGGMGEVYRARDSRLKREVALKVLPEAFSNDPDRLARFEREAQVLASLNHPHIAAIYGVEDAAGGRALVMELIDGPTLADRLRRGPLPIAEALAIARQIADALEAAHDHGIVHRDLKPANIKVREDDTVKVLDFGLARIEPGGADSDPESSPTVTAATRAGAVLGTAPYMSPEQARGRRVDKRTDVWAFGCVLYEMLSGQRAFGRETATDTMAAVLEREPDWSRLPAATPASVRRLLRRCVDKDPRRRLRDIADARPDLEDAPAEERNPSPSRPPAVAPIGIALLAGALLAGGIPFLRQWTATPPPEFSRIVRITSGPAKEVGPAISPDGKWIAYVSDVGGTPDIWVKFIAGGEAANLTAGTDLEVSSGTGIGGLEISPDGTRIAVMARRRGSATPFATWELPAPLPGQPRKLLDDNFLGMRWSPDGQRIVFISAGAASGDGLYLADADGSNRTPLIEPHDGMHIHWPAWAPDDYIYFIRTFTTVSNLDQSEIYRIDSRGGRAMEPVVEAIRRAQFPLPLAQERGLVYSANPSTAEMRLWWRSIDGRASRPLITGVGEYAEPRASADGRTLVCTLYEQRQSLTRVQVTPGSAIVTLITDEYHGNLDPALSPLGDRIVFSSSRDGNRHLWSARADGSDTRPLTSGASEDDRPAWSPDGRQIAFASDRGGTRGIWVVPADGGPPRKVIDAKLSGGMTWSGDGRHLIYGAGAGAGTGLWKVAASGGIAEQIPTPHFASEPAWSPTREVIAYITIRRINNVSMTGVGFVDPGGKPVYDLPDPPIGNGFSNGIVAWSPDGRRLAVVRQQSNSAASIWLVDPEAAQPYTKLIEFPPGPRVRGLAWSRDGKELIIGKHDWTSDIVLLDQNR